jgi:Zn-dependent protease
VFRLLGFDVTVRTGFVLFTLLLVMLYRNEFGVWLAGSIAAFTLIHELGHAVAARSAGAEASISLDFMAGYTSFRPGRPISRRRHALISVAGPGTEILVGLAVLAAMGVNPLSRASVGESAASNAIWWAGPALGLLNLIPVLPLDGGHIAQSGLEAVLRRGALREMALASLAVTIAAAVAMAVTGRTGFVIFVGFLMITQIQLVQMTSRKPPPHPQVAAARAETEAWNTGDLLHGELRQQFSPWLHADRALRSGRPDQARRAILDDLQSPSVPAWSPPASAPRERLRAIVDLLPVDLPGGNRYSSRVLADVLMAVGERQRGGEYAAAAFARDRTSALATTVARAAAGLGDVANAVAWLRAAAYAAADEDEIMQSVLGRTMDIAPEFANLREIDEFVSLRESLR